MLEEVIDFQVTTHHETENIVVVKASTRFSSKHFAELMTVMIM